MRKTVFALGCVLAFARVAAASSIVLYSNLAVDGKMAAASRPDINPALKEIEAADDFVVGGGGAAVTEVKFIGLLTGGATPLDVDFTNLEFYRVFPNDSNPPDNRVPTRANSPSDNAFAEVASPGIASLTATTLAGAFTAANSVQNGINPSPGQTTHGEGPVTGTEVLFDVVLTSPIDLPADHYFFVPQLDIAGGGAFYWLSAVRPIVPPGTPFPPGVTDLQAWIRNSDLDPDWLRIGTDIVGGTPAPTFNMAFEIDAVPVPEPATLFLVGTGLVFAARRVRRTTT